MSADVASVKVSISLPDEHARIMRELAVATFEGKLSHAFRRLIETHPVTKSAFKLST